MAFSEAHRQLFFVFFFPLSTRVSSSPLSGNGLANEVKLEINMIQTLSEYKSRRLNCMC